MTQLDQENNPPSFIERLDLILCKIWFWISVCPLLTLLYTGLTGQILIPTTVEGLKNYRLGLILIGIGCLVLYSIFSGIVFLITGKRTDLFVSTEKTTVQVYTVILFIISIGYISWLIPTK